MNLVSPQSPQVHGLRHHDDDLHALRGNIHDVTPYSATERTGALDDRSGLPLNKHTYLWCIGQTAKSASLSTERHCRLSRNWKPYGSLTTLNWPSSPTSDSSPEKRQESWLPSGGFVFLTQGARTTRPRSAPRWTTQVSLWGEATSSHPTTLDKILRKTERIIRNDHPEQQSGLHSLQYTFLTIIYKIEMQRGPNVNRCSIVLWTLHPRLWPHLSHTTHNQQQFI